MSLSPFDYAAPTTLEEALGLLARWGGEAAVIAGGTEIMGRLKHRLVRPSHVISLRQVPGLSGLRSEGAEIVIGPMTTLREVARSPVIEKACNALTVAAEAVGAPPIQNVASIGGNLLQNSRCLFYNQSELVRKAEEACLKQGGNVCIAVGGSRKCFSVYQGDMAPVLMCCGAKVTLQKKGGSRTCPVSALFTGSGEWPLSIEKDELLTEIRIPVPSLPSASVFKKLRLRGSLDYPLASAAVCLTRRNGSIAEAAIVIGACGPAPMVVAQGEPPGEIDGDQAGEIAARMFQAVDNLGMPGSYRRKMIRVLTARAVREALDHSGKAGS